MGQKSNPISLRLKKTNQHWNSCWYGDIDYTAQFLENCRIIAYVQNICQQKKEAFPVICTKRSRQQIDVLLILPQKKRPNTGLFPRSIINHQDWFLQTLDSAKPLTPKALWGSEGTQNNEQNSFFAKRLLARDSKYFPKSSDTYGVRRHLLFFLASIFLEIRPSNFFFKIAQIVLTSSIRREEVREKSSARLLPRKKTGGLIENHLEKCMGVALGARCKLYFLKCSSPHQNPFFLASIVVSSLQERIPFRRVKHRLVKDISKKWNVGGVRITCSGRVASRSKKAQKRKIESIQWGATSLNVFSEQVHFASKSAFTPFGKVGVKVWISYKNHKNSTPPLR